MFLREVGSSKLFVQQGGVALHMLMCKEHLWSSQQVLPVKRT